MVTMKKIAELCGVSRGTVDRALNGRGRVNAETAAMIKKMAEQLGYEPNPAGKALAARKNHPVIGVLLPSEGNAFFNDVIHGMDRAASSYAIYGLTVRYYPMKGYDVDKQLHLMEQMKGKVNALIISPIDDARIAKAIDEFVDAGIFVVTVVNDIKSSKRHCYVGSDYFNLARRSARRQGESRHRHGQPPGPRSLREAGGLPAPHGKGPGLLDRRHHRERR